MIIHNLTSNPADLPRDNQYVLAHVVNRPWGDRHDPNGNRFWKVVKFISEPYDLRFYRGNNERPFFWKEFGPDRYDGQEIDKWCELPEAD